MRTRNDGRFRSSVASPRIACGRGGAKARVELASYGGAHGWRPRSFCQFCVDRLMLEALDLPFDWLYILCRSAAECCRHRRLPFHCSEPRKKQL